MNEDVVKDARTELNGDAAHRPGDPEGSLPVQGKAEEVSQVDVVMLWVINQIGGEPSAGDHLPPVGAS